MPSWKTLGAGCLTILALVVASGGCITSFVLFAQAMEQEARPNNALIVFALTVIVGSLLVVAARVVSKDPDE
ncbi:MAG: hypothetical protein OXI33_18215 [Chloroflexota bacterium]|nr:hypothetical protein [Chloroflexota bacterium]